jgi:FdhD protein
LKSGNKNIYINIKNYLDEKPTLPVLNWQVEKWQAGQFALVEDLVAIEEPCELRLNGRSLATIMRTPGSLENDRELAMGFLLSEGIISNPIQVASISRAKDVEDLPLENVFDIVLVGSNNATLDSSYKEDNQNFHFERRFLTGSSCGLCGKTALAEICRRLPALPPDDFSYSAKMLYTLTPQLRTAQVAFDCTGGLHSAGLFDQTGALVISREDIGRHNAVDKIVGRMALNHLYPLNQVLLLVSGRISFELVQKALSARIPIIAGVSAPSSLALELAADSNITLISFLRENHFNVYTHPKRIKA